MNHVISAGHPTKHQRSPRTEVVSLCACFNSGSSENSSLRTKNKWIYYHETHHQLLYRKFHFMSKSLLQTKIFYTDLEQVFLVKGRAPEILGRKKEFQEPFILFLKQLNCWFSFPRVLEDVPKSSFYWDGGENWKALLLLLNSYSRRFVLLCGCFTLLSISNMIISVGEG